MVGTIFDLPDDMRLQRGMTFTILPDGRMLRVPAMSRIEVRAHADSHEQDGGKDMMQALTDMLRGKKPVQGRAKFNRRGRAHKVGADIRGDPAPFDPQGGLRPAGLEAGGIKGLHGEA